MQRVTARDKRYLKDIKFKLKIVAVAHVICFLLVIPLYHYEVAHSESQIKTMWDAIYLASVTIATIGYGDIVPVTPQGKFIVVLVWFMTRMAMVAVIFVAASRILLGRSNDLTKDERLYLVEQELKRVHALVADSGKELSIHIKELRSDKAQRRKFFASSFTSLKDVASCCACKVSVVECCFSVKDLGGVQQSDLYLVYSSAKRNGIRIIKFKDKEIDLNTEIE
ncbi:potassium channel family protein [Vibrio sp. D431a]|uniref:potassium channel family protein n=1 Tax=Vibrio sp. D431a TaxID=2837388 RepID=UPI0025556258|nr:potassium channel family protein [Vibrio sp. D431a]MDK9790159.1 hypothetical protein [Vibrio sp. D431a]